MLPGLAAAGARERAGLFRELLFQAAAYQLAQLGDRGVGNRVEDFAARLFARKACAPAGAVKTSGFTIYLSHSLHRGGKWEGLRSSACSSRGVRWSGGRRGSARETAGCDTQRWPQ